MNSPRSLAEDIREDLQSTSFAVMIDTETKTAIEKWLEADKEFNTWFLVTTKGSLDDDALMGLLDGYRETQELAEDAWRAFVDKEADAAELRAGLDDSLAKMTELMKK